MAHSGLGRGALFIPLAKVWFIIASFAINFGLPNLLDPDGVGDYGVVNRLIGVINMLMITGTIQAVAKFVAEDPTRSVAFRRWALRAQLLFAGTVSVILFFAAGWIAGLFNDPGLTPYFRIVAWIPLFYGLYAVQIGLFNGLKDFFSQAAFDIAYATLRAGGILAAAALGLGVGGVFGAFTAAALVILVVAMIVGRPGKGTRSGAASGAGMGVTPGEVVRFAVPVMSLVLVSQWLLSFDLFWLKALLPPEVSSFESGAYFGMLNLALVPYMLVLSVNFIVFPLVSRSTFENDADTTKEYIRQSLRIAFLVALVMEAVLIASPEAAVGMVYPSKPEYQEYASALRILAPGYVALCVFGISTAIVNAAGRPGLSFAAALAALSLQGLLCWTLIPHLGMTGAAWASTVAFAVGMKALALYLVRRWGTWLTPLTVVRGLVAAAAAVAFGVWLPWTGILFLLEALLSASIFAGVAWILGEIGAADVERFMRLAGRSV